MTELARVQERVTEGAQESGARPLARRSWEVFCGVATGYSGGDPATATDAYLQAYPRTRSRAAARANAARLAARPEVQARCEWMRSQLADSVLMDSAAVRARITNLRLEMMERTRNTKHKALALMAARDLERGLGLVGDGKVSATAQVSAPGGDVLVKIAAVIDQVAGGE